MKHLLWIVQETAAMIADVFLEMLYAFLKKIGLLDSDDGYDYRKQHFED